MLTIIIIFNNEGNIFFFCFLILKKRAKVKKLDHGPSWTSS
jgi:hypothetical protein